MPSGVLRSLLSLVFFRNKCTKLERGTPEAHPSSLLYGSLSSSSLLVLQPLLSHTWTQGTSPLITKMTCITSYFTSLSFNGIENDKEKRSGAEKGNRAFPELEVILHLPLKANPETTSTFPSRDRILVIFSS